MVSTVYCDVLLIEKFQQLIKYFSYILAPRYEAGENFLYLVKLLNVFT